MSIAFPFKIKPHFSELADFNVFITAVEWISIPTVSLQRRWCLCWSCISVLYRAECLDTVPLLLTNVLSYFTTNNQIEENHYSVIIFLEHSSQRCGLVRFTVWWLFVRGRTMWNAVFQLQPRRDFERHYNLLKHGDLVLNIWERSVECLKGI